VTDATEGDQERGKLRGSYDQPEEVAANLKNSKPLKRRSKPKLQHAGD
jgi:hypothetical protein